MPNAPSLALERMIAQRSSLQAMGGLKACLGLIEAAMEEARYAPNQTAFNVHMDHAERVAEQMEGVLIDLRRQLSKANVDAAEDAAHEIDSAEWDARLARQTVGKINRSGVLVR